MKRQRSRGTTARTAAGMRSPRPLADAASDAEADDSCSSSHAARKALFTRALRRGWLRLDEIDVALPSGSLSEAERWLLLASLRAAGVELQDGAGRLVPIPSASKALRKGAA